MRPIRLCTTLRLVDHPGIGEWLWSNPEFVSSGESLSSRTTFIRSGSSGRYCRIAFARIPSTPKESVPVTPIIEGTAIAYHISGDTSDLMWATHATF